MALTGKISVFLLSGRLWEVVAHEVSTVLIVVINECIFCLTGHEDKTFLGHRNAMGLTF